MEKILQVEATITTRCRLQIVQDVYEKLDTNYRNKLSESCFGSLLRLKDIKLASQVIHQLLLRKLRTNKKEVWFKIGEKNTKFGLEEFILVTGLNAGDENDVDKTLGEECRIVKEYFRNSGGKITKGDAYNAFVICKKRKSDKYKLGLIVILAYVLWATEENTYIDLWWLDLVDDLDRFETYPWGKFSFEYTISIFKRKMGDKLKSSDVGGESRCRYSLHGFPLAIMIWAFEAIPTLGMKFGMKYPDIIPRMVAWEMPKRLTSAVIENVLNSKELEVNSTLIPTEAELEEAYWKELKPIVEEDESVSYHSEGDEAEQDAEPQHSYHEESPRTAQPPQRGFEINIEDLLRTEIEKLEGRLQAVISTRLDRVEKKVDRLVELAVAGRFHPATSAFDGATSSTAHVPENEPKDELEKEVGFDDVTDVHAAERKVDLPEEDSKLEEEEEVRGKNVGGKELETEPGFDDVRDVPVAETNVETREEDPKLEEEVRGKNVGGKDLEKEAGSGNDIDVQENEKMIKESVGKEIILEDERPDVEKGIADFMTPEKHDVDTNESTQGDVVEIDEAGSDPLKGRGYRRKRKARLLCSPYTDPTKRRKLLDINVYDPYREVDPSKVEDFCKWMETTPSCKIIPLRFYDIQAKSLMDLSKEDGWINDSIMNEALYQIRERASRFPNLFRQDCCILDTYFYQFVVNTYGQLQSSKELKCSKSLMNYVRGATPELGKPWRDCKYLYLPCWTRDHWFAVQVDIEERAILMFDSLKGHIRRAALEAYLLPLQVLIPLIIKSHVTSESKYSTENFKFVNVKDVPQQVNGSDCGIFAIKFIEFLQANMNVNTIRSDYVPVWRKKLAAELLAWDFEP